MKWTRTSTKAQKFRKSLNLKKRLSKAQKRRKSLNLTPSRIPPKAERAGNNEALERANRQMREALSRYFEGETDEELSINALAYAEQRDPDEYREEYERLEEYERMQAENEDLKNQLLSAQVDKMMREDLATVQVSRSSGCVLMAGFQSKKRITLARLWNSRKKSLLLMQSARCLTRKPNATTIRPKKSTT